MPKSFFVFFAFICCSQNLLALNSSFDEHFGSSVTIATSKKNKKPLGHPPKGTSSPPKNDLDSGSSASLRIYAGPYLGVKDIKGTILTYGLDYGVKKFGLQFLLGTSLWQHTHRDEFTDAVVVTKITFFSLDGGLAYPWLVSTNVPVEFGGRIGYGVVRITSNFAFDTGQTEISEGRKSFFISPFIGLRYRQFKSFEYGLEYRKPVFVNKDISEYSGYHIYLHFAVLLSG